MIAKRGAELVKITYQDLDVILTIEDAVAAKSFYEYNNKIKRGRYWRDQMKNIPSLIRISG